MARKVTTESFGREVLDSRVPVLVDFYADWCGPCRLIAPTLDELANEADGRYDVVKVDTDRDPELAARYGISGLPTLLLFRDGDVVDRYLGVQNAARLRAALEAAVAQNV